MVQIDPNGTKAPKRRWRIALGVLILICIVGAGLFALALRVGWILEDFGAPSGEFDPPEFTIELCADADADTVARIEANLVGDPLPTIEAAQAAAFNIDGEQSRIVGAQLAGFGSSGPPDGATAVFIVGPSGSIFALADGIADEFSTFEMVSPGLELDVRWGHAIGHVRGC